MKFVYSMIVIFITTSVLFAQNNSKYKFLGSYSAIGVPDYLEQDKDIIDTSFLSLVNRSLPETKPVPLFHPEYISQKSETDVILHKSGEIWVTFVSEGADYKNILGFYTYDVNNPPKTVSDVKNRTIIFPNISFQNSGGGLLSGMKVKIGKFEANTGIGWFIIANGWQNGSITNGYNIFYSESILNPESDATKKAHTVLLNDQQRSKFILGFEDIRRDQNSDNDFNDAIFYVTASPNDAVFAQDVVAVTPKPAEDAKPSENPKIDPNTGPSGIPPANDPGKNINTSINNNQTGNSVNNNAVNNGNNNTVIINNNTTIVNNNNNNNTRDNQQRNRNQGSNRSNSNTNYNKNSSVTICTNQGLGFSDFENAKSTLVNQYVEENKKTVIKQIVRNRQLTVSQIVEFLKLIKVEQYRLEMAKYLYDFTCDKDNYYQVNTILLANSIRELDAYLQKKYKNDIPPNSTNQNSIPNYSDNNNTSNQNPNPACINNFINDTDFSDLKASIKTKWFSDGQMTVMKQGVDGRCLSVNQVKELMQIFSFESDKLSVAKYLYDFTGDKKNYYKVNDLFGFQTTITELDNYLKSKK